MKPFRESNLSLTIIGEDCCKLKNEINHIIGKRNM